MNSVKELLSIKDDDIVKLRNCYDKTESDMKRDVLILKEWLKQQTHLPNDEGKLFLSFNLSAYWAKFGN